MNFQKYFYFVLYYLKAFSNPNFNFWGSVALLEGYGVIEPSILRKKNERLFSGNQEFVPLVSNS